MARDVYTGQKAELDIERAGKRDLHLQPYHIGNQEEEDAEDAKHQSRGDQIENHCMDWRYGEKKRFNGMLEWEEQETNV